MVDICLLVEGSYPFTSGGVSSWLHALITNLPEYSFAVVHLSSTPDAERRAKYPLPANVTELREVFIHDARALHGPRQGSRGSASRAGAPHAWEGLRALHEAMPASFVADNPALLRWLRSPDLDGLGASDLFSSRHSWDMVLDRYRTRAPESPFLEYFWTFRYTHLPIFALLEAELPEARIYHAISTGYNGFLGALAKLRTGRPLLVTEHGIYVREREIEIAQADWITAQRQELTQLDRRLSFFQSWWLDMFRFMTTFSYDHADTIISITGAHRRYQLRNGADPRKMFVIPNGIDITRLDNLRPAAPNPPDRFSVGFVGRVVPIKDVKTFIRAINIARSVIPNLVAHIVGPFDEDPDYFAECAQLVANMDLAPVIHFTGNVDVRKYYRTIDVLVLTSLSEGQPLVILEGNCAGIPVIATDVGACREMLTGGMPEDQQLGASGLLTPAASPERTADALIRLWRDAGLREAMARAGKERVRRYYRQEILYAAYRDLYRRHL